jgi:hypothetical protein
LEVARLGSPHAHVRQVVHRWRVGRACR